MHTNLRSFMKMLQRENQIIEINAEVDPYLELAEIHRRVIEDEGPALLFTNVKGSKFPVVTNLFGTRERVEMAIGPRPEAIVKKITQAMDKLLPPKLSNLWQERDWLFSIAKSGLRRVSPAKAPVLQVRQPRVNLKELPVLTSWQGDGGPFVTLPLVYTEHPVTREHNLGMYRIQIFSENQTGMHWQIHKGGGFHYHEAEKRGHALPVTLFLGGPPALVIAAITALPESLPELIYASFLMGEKLNMAEIDGHPHPLIAEAEFAVCGEVPPFERKPEGPFGDHYGYYSLVHDFPVFNVKQVYHRKDAIYPATVVGKPRQEDYFIGEWMQDLLAPLFPLIMPGVKSLWTYAEAGFHTLAGAVVRESYHREALAHAFRILGEGQLALTKFLMITDVPVDLKKFPVFLESVLARFNPARDLFIINNTAMDTLDYTGRKFNQGSKAIMLGLGDPVRDLPGEYTGGPIAGIEKIKPYCRGCLMISGSAYSAAPDLARQVVEHGREQLQEWPLVILVDDADALKDQTGFLWTVFTRFDPAWDIYAAYEVGHNKIVYSGPIVIDARMKPDYPDELIPREDIVRQVSQRWKELFGEKQ
ncbi:UbiD family decarboxylase [Thermincola potens]|uniref:UbiD family decarboxylase n=1 Tax=Thermincola potens (strain JR) TaxID=635013 RepID=D5XAY1_THEPJ|nr:UbiD family decarboxylase [Thermincola potens]ADG83335.1 UbiD family decarboxylase [Thermincola potens JR]